MDSQTPTPNMFPTKKPAQNLRQDSLKVTGEQVMKASSFPRNIHSCHHVPMGSVWCQECANANLVYWRRKVSKSKQPIDALPEGLKVNITKALHEFELTTSGLRALEQAYLQIAADDPLKSLEAHTAWMSKVREAATRNTKAKHHSKDMRTFVPVGKYVPPPKNSMGKFDTSKVLEISCNLHTKKRMTLRNITMQQIREAFSHFNTIEPKGQGNWKITGKNGVSVCGYFESVGSEYRFTAITTYYEEKLIP